MAEIASTDAALVIPVMGWDKVWALTSQLTIPLAHVVSAEPAAEEARRWWQGVRLPGTHIPGVITAGTLYKESKRVFWDVQDAERAVVIHLRDDQYTDLIIEVADPAATIALITSRAQR